MSRKEYFRCAPKREGRKEMRFDHAIFLEGFLSREKEDGSKKGGYRGNRRGLINRKGEDQGWQQCVSGRTMGEGRSCDKRRGRGL